MRIDARSTSDPYISILADFVRIVLGVRLPQLSRQIHSSAGRARRGDI